MKKKDKIITISVFSLALLGIVGFWGQVVHIFNTRLFDIPIQKSIFVPTGAVTGAGATMTNYPFTIGIAVIIVALIALAVWGFSKLKK